MVVYLDPLGYFEAKVYTSWVHGPLGETLEGFDSNTSLPLLLGILGWLRN